jgi:endonuclease/exonuclease/phosphatase family metal-dependent hydrolase
VGYIRPIVFAISGFYLVALCVCAALLRAESDRWWVATLIMFSPRWLWGAPLAALVPWSALFQRRLLWVLAGCSAIWLWPILNISVPWPLWDPTSGRGHTLRVMTCNGDYRALDAMRLKQLIEGVEPDIVMFQDAPSRTILEAFNSADWHIQVVDGFIAVSRYPMQNLEPIDTAGSELGPGVCARTEIETPLGVVRLFNVHLASPRSALQSVIGRQSGEADEVVANSRLRQKQSIAVRSFVGESSAPTIILGDFNTPIESQIYRQVWADYTNAFSARGWGVGNTHFTRRTGVRIDHILVSSQFVVQKCWIGPNIGSAHRPVIADLQQQPDHD